MIFPRAVKTVQKKFFDKPRRAKEINMKMNYSNSHSIRNENDIREYKEIAKKITQEILNSKYQRSDCDWNYPGDNTAGEIENNHNYFSTEFSNPTKLAYWKGTLATLNWVLGHERYSLDIEYPDEFFDEILF